MKGLEGESGAMIQTEIHRSKGWRLRSHISCFLFYKEGVPQGLGHPLF
ncbi:hypothetical protein BRO54_0340 [Geobacillus proteiniphilus]|uniref:Uncharacterized protein n=1 Tax=Geobacillus proteiniphilus TaxID=860353 RepID=A0A1Q5T986_9BACL|nr:hypothetical protein GARCT_03441 [Geobacillus sp. 12AMOR1]OKO96787.1 hypothetical protein BRO54_0340 [Geobacillus proteiniphilus]STO35940.1 Uncharacterised protein [[Flavobacterium] thermophilum]